MSAPNPDPDWRPGSGTDGGRPGHDAGDLHRFLAPGSNLSSRADGSPLLPTAGSGADRSRRRGARAGRIPGPRPGWYAYRVAGPAELPWWATEVALAIERPPAQEPDGAAGRTAAARPAEPGWTGDQVQAMVLLRAPGRAPWLAGAAEAIAEVERAAGLQPAGRADLVAGVPSGIRSRLMPAPGLPGLVPVAPAAVRAGLGAAGARGLPAPLRRWRPAAGAVAWRPSAGAVVTCEGPCGVSAQAVVALRGPGNALAITPPPGGALVLRAWRSGRSWGVACGLVIGRDSALGLGREAGRVAARARVDGWHAAVVNGSTALHLAGAGDPRSAAPEAAAHAASASQVAALFEACLMAAVDCEPNVVDVPVGPVTPTVPFV